MLHSLELFVCAASLIYGSVIFFAYCLSSVVANNKKLIVSALISVALGILLLFIRSALILVIGKTINLGFNNFFNFCHKIMIINGSIIKEITVLIKIQSEVSS